MRLVSAHPWLSCQTSSMRSRMYGIHPTWLSAYDSLRFGCRMRAPENRKSVSENIAFAKARVAVTAGGASAVVAGILDDEPMCMQTTVSVSAHAAKNGSQ